jgi:CheY-like chemotaxis protein
VIEDEHQVRTLFVLMLEQLGYNVFEAAHPNEAAAIWKRESKRIGLIVADIWLPGISGPELINFFRREQPNFKCIFVSGLNPEIRPEFRKLTRNCEVLQKPVSKEQMAAALGRLFAD